MQDGFDKSVDEMDKTTRRTKACLCGVLLKVWAAREKGDKGEFQQTVSKMQGLRKSHVKKQAALNEQFGTA
jgi:hypothetical protein